MFETFETFYENYELLLESNKRFNVEPIIVKRGVSTDWMNAFLKAIKIVPQTAIPTVFGNFATYQQSTGRKIDTLHATNFYGVTVDSSSVDVPKELVPQEIIDHKIEIGWLDPRVLELTKSINIPDVNLDMSIVVMGVNCRKFKGNSDIKNRKDSVNERETESKGYPYFLNTTLSGVVFHEMGHVFSNRNRISTSSTWKTLSQKWYHETKIGVLKSENEAWAEAFSNYFDKKGEDLPDYIYEHVKTEINKKRITYKF